MKAAEELRLELEMVSVLVKDVIAGKTIPVKPSIPSRTRICHHRVLLKVHDHNVKFFEKFLEFYNDSKPRFPLMICDRELKWNVAEEHFVLASDYFDYKEEGSTCEQFTAYFMFRSDSSGAVDNAEIHFISDEQIASGAGKPRYRLGVCGDKARDLHRMNQAGKL